MTFEQLKQNFQFGNLIKCDVIEIKKGEWNLIVTARNGVEITMTKARTTDDIRIFSTYLGAVNTATKIGFKNINSTFL